MNKKMRTIETEIHSSWGMEQHHSERAASATVFMIGDDEDATIAMTVVVAIGYMMELICVFVSVFWRTKKKDVHSSEERSVAENWKFRWSAGNRNWNAIVGSAKEVVGSLCTGRTRVSFGCSFPMTVL